MEDEDIFLDLTVKEIRDWLEGDETVDEKIAGALDELQALVHGGEAESATLHITARKEIANG